MEEMTLHPHSPQAGTPETAFERPNYLNAEYGWKSWLFTLDHKRIAILYLISTVTAFFGLGGIFAGLMRLELLTPEGDMMGPDTYNRVFTMHGIIMVFFFLIPAIPAVLGNFLVPLMIGAKDLAMPRLNLASWYVYNIGGLFTPLGDRQRRRRHRLDLLHAVLDQLLEHLRGGDRPRHLHHRLLRPSSRR